MKNMKLLIVLLLLIFGNKLFCQTSVDYSSGTAAVSLPLLELSGYSMSIPVGLSYNTSGIKVNDVAARTGLGWNLSGGGQISRSINGLPDETIQTWQENDAIPFQFQEGQISKAGFLWCKDFYRNDASNEFEYPMMYKDEMMGGVFDLEPDEFYISAPGLQAKFVFGLGVEKNSQDFLSYDGSIQTQRSPVMILPYQNLLVEYTMDPTLDGSFTEFIITNESGYKYYFTIQDRIEIEARRYSIDGLIDETNSEFQTTGWMLTKIENPNGFVEAEFEYIQNTSSSEISNYSELTFSSEGEVHHIIEKHSDIEFGTNLLDNDQNFYAPCQNQFDKIINLVTIKQRIWNLHEIKSRNSEIILNQSSNERVDLPGDFPLEYLDLYENDILIRRIKLVYDYFLSDPNITHNQFVKAQDKYRLRLKSIINFNSANVAVNKGTEFIYTTGFVPPRNSFAQDFWGYYNERINNNGLAFGHDFRTPVTSKSYTDRSSSYNEVFCLKKIVNANGGYQSLEYEAQRYSAIEGVAEPDKDVEVEEVVTAAVSLTHDYYDEPEQLSSSETFAITKKQVVTIEYNIERSETFTIDLPETPPTGPWQYASPDNGFTFSNGYDWSWVTPELELNYSSELPWGLNFAEIEDGFNFVSQPNEFSSGCWLKFTLTNSASTFGKSFFKRYNPLDFSQTFDFLLEEDQYTIQVEIIGRRAVYRDYSLTVSATYNSFSNEELLPNITGGKRIKAIITSDGDDDPSNDIIKRFTYSSNVIDPTNECSGMLLTKPVQKMSVYNGQTNTVRVRHSTFGINNDDYLFKNYYNCHHFSASSYSYSPLLQSNGSHVMYSIVHSHAGDSPYVSGYETFNYDVSVFSVLDGTYGTLQCKPVWKNSILRMYTSYNNELNIVSQQEYLYEDIPMGYTMNSKQMFATGTDGELYQLLQGIDPEVLNDMMVSALLNSGTAIVTAVLTAPTVGLSTAATVALVIHCVNIARAISLSIFNHGVETTINSEGLINNYGYRNQNISSSWYRLAETKTTTVDDNNAQYLTMKTEYSYMPVPAQRGDGIFELTTSPTQSLTYNEQKPDDIRGVTTKYSIQYTCEGCEVDADGSGFATKTLYANRMWNVPIEVLQLSGSNINEMKVVGGEISYLLPANELISQDVPSVKGALLKAIHPLHLEVPTSLITFIWSYVDSNGNMIYDSNYGISSAIGMYDASLMPSLVETKDGLAQSVIRMGDSHLPVVSVVNAFQDEVRYMGFETYEDGNVQWGIAENYIENNTQIFQGLTIPTAKTGQQYYKFGPSISANLIPVGRYSLSFWSKNNTIIVSGTNLSGPISVNSQAVETDILGWKYYEYSFLSNGNASISISGPTNAIMDEVRIFPQEAFMSTSQFNDIGQLISTSDVNNECEYYFYDEHLRPKLLIDDDHSIRNYTNYKDIQANDPQGTRPFVLSRNVNLEYVHYSTVSSLNEGTLGDMQTVRTFFDGLGRPIQSIGCDATTEGLFPRDVVSFTSYDEFGAAPRQYLPYAHSNANHEFRVNAIQEQLNFYDQEDDISNTLYPFSETLYSPNPIRTVKEQSFPGEEFQLGTNHTIKRRYYFNLSGEVRNWVVQWSTEKVIQDGYWPEGSLIKTETEDENGKLTWIYKDFFGRTILKRQPIYINGVDENGKPFTDDSDSEVLSYTPNWNADNYFLYDRFHRPYVEITPNMLRSMELTGMFAFYANNDEDQDNLAFVGYANAWRYNKKGQLIETKTPDAQRTYFVYDNNDRLVMSQDAQQKVDNAWSIIRYDRVGRIVLTGNTYTMVPISRADAQLTWTNALTGLWETKNASELRYTDTSPFQGNTEWLTANYYDNYYFDIQGATTQDNFSASKRTRGKITGNKVRVLESMVFNTTVNYFDTKGRTAQVFETNSFGGYDKYKYSFDNKSRLSETWRTHFNLETGSDLVVYNKYAYDQIGRLQRVFQRTGDEDEPLVQLQMNEYNQLGQLHKKHLHKTSDMYRALQIVDYRYTIRGWLKKINNSNLSPDGDNEQSDDVFGEELLYTQDDYYFENGVDWFDGNCEHRAQKLYNGVPSTIKWNINNTYNASDPSIIEDGTTIPEKSYVYRYDNLYRMTGAYSATESLSLEPGNGNCPEQYGRFVNDWNHYNEQVKYDLGGNILQLSRNNNLEPSGLDMDVLKFEYYDNSNKLKKITDFAGDYGQQPEFTQYIDGSDLPEEMTYDPQGNLLQDFDRNLIFRYNSIGLVKQVDKTGESNEIQIVYDAEGNKLSKSTGTNYRAFIDGIEYSMENGIYTLIKIETAIGWVRPTSESAVNETDFVYDFYVTDHLGNIRVVVTEESFTEIAVATLEPEHIEDEIGIFDGVINPNTTTPSGWPISTDINHVVSKLSSGGHVVGPSRLVSVKRSDALSVEVESYYTEDEGLTTGQSMAQILTGLLLGLGAQAPGIIPSGEQGMDVFANPASAQSAQLFQFLSDTQTMEDLQKPKSYLVYLFFDKNLMLDGQYSGIIQVGRAGQLNLLQQHLSAMQREGYFYTYVTNQSERRVYYNNLTLVHKRGNIVQSNDYYPFGLTWENPKDDLHTYQGKELQRNEWSSGGLEMLDFRARMYNPLIGRWHNPDPMNQFDSPYNAMGNNPVINIDPDGMWSLPLGGILTGLSFTQIRYIANPRTMNNDPYMTTSGGMLQVAGAAISLWEGGKILSDGLYHLGFNTITNLNPEPFLGQVIYAYNYKDNQQYFYSLSIEWYKEEDISNFIGPRDDIISVSLSIEYIDNLPEGATAWFNGEVGNRGIYQMTDEEIAEYEESKLSYGPDVSLGGKAALKAGIKAARNAKKAAKGVDGLLKAGNALDKGGFTAVGRALQKHGSRTGSIFPKATGNPAAINAQGEAVLNGILTNPNVTSATRHHARFGNVLEYKIPGGQGARFSGDGKTFIGFLE